jgi:hypothetical protein
MEPIRAAELLVEKIKKNYSEDVAVVVIMGSTIYNDTHPKSDLDMYFVVNNPRGYELAMTFIIDGIGFDFWPISWERLTRIANYEERITSILTEGKVIYSGSEEDLKRFNDLKASALDTSDRKKFVEKSRKVFDQVYKHYFLLEQSSDISSARKHGINVIFTLTYALALLNRDTIKRGRGKLKSEIMSMNLVPEDFELNYDVIFDKSSLTEIKEASMSLIQSTETLLKSEEQKLLESRDFKDQLDGFYEELINFYNKINHGCEVGDYVTAFYAAAEIENEIDDVLEPTGQNSKQLPDMIGAYDPNYISGFLSIVEVHQKAFEKMLADNGVKLKTFQNMDDLEQFLAT